MDRCELERPGGGEGQSGTGFDRLSRSFLQALCFAFSRCLPSSLSRTRGPLTGPLERRDGVRGGTGTQWGLRAWCWVTAHPTSAERRPCLSPRSSSESGVGSRLGSSEAPAMLRVGRGRGRLLPLPREGRHLAPEPSSQASGSISWRRVSEKLAASLPGGVICA